MELINKHIQAIKNPQSYTGLLEAIGDAEIVLLGESTHGTTEFYSSRIEISKRLIQEKNFRTIAIEGDWPDVYSLNSFTNSNKPKDTLLETLQVFKRFPQWMWANEVIYNFLIWLRDYNQSQLNQRVCLYGLDIYSLHQSIKIVLDYLQKNNSEAVEIARQRYACFNNGNFNAEEEFYLKPQLIEACHQKVIAQFKEMLNQYEQGNQEDHHLFNAVQNARLIKNAENYYRQQFAGNVESWNARDTHMFEMFESIKEHKEKNFTKPQKIIIWAHNTHVGNAKATEFSKRGELNIGQLLKEKYGEKVFSIGYTTYHGTVRAASYWGESSTIKTINAAISGSYESLFNESTFKDFFLILKNNNELKKIFAHEFLERAIGVIYLPQFELQSHYFDAKLTEQFDAVIHFDKTTALQPLFAETTV